MKVFLQVPYHLRRQAKSCGAHWDKVAKKWYVLSRPEFLLCRSWWPEITAEIKAWLDDPELSKHYGAAVAATHNPVRRTSGRETDRRLRTIKSKQKMDRYQLKMEKQRRRWKSKLKTGKTWRNAARIPAGPYSDSTTEIKSVTVKLPL